MRFLDGGGSDRAGGVIHQDGAARLLPHRRAGRQRVASAAVGLVEAMTAGGLHAPLQTDIRGQIWTKMINSLCWNQAAFLTEAINGEFGDAPDTVEVVRQMMVEMERVAEALGATIPVPMEKRITMTVKATDHTMSMLQDLQRGRPIEIDVLADSVAAMSEAAGVETPTVSALIALTKLKGRMRGVYGG